MRLTARSVNEAQTESRQSAIESGLARMLMAQTDVARAIGNGPVVQICAGGNDTQRAWLPCAATVEVNTGDARSALRAIERLSSGLAAILAPDVLHLLMETRQFLGACFAKLAEGGVLVVTTPHQFLHERKLRLPSRRDAQHRRFFTPNTLMAEMEEAIDPCAFRLRYLADYDEGYDYRAPLAAEPQGGQDIVAVIEKIAAPHWRGELERDEIWAQTPMRPGRLLEIDRHAPAPIETLLPDHSGVTRIAVVKLDHRGDFLMATEAFAVLRRAFPQAQMTLICGSWNVAEAETLGWFSEVIPFDFFPEDDSAREEMQPREQRLERIAEAMRGRSFDLAVDFRLFDDTREVLKQIDARNRAGFDRYDAFPWLTIRLNLPSGTEDDGAEAGFVPAEPFSTSLCRHMGYEIRNDQPIRAEGHATAVWGPYKPLKAGHYRFECLIEPLGDEFDLPFDVAVNSGFEILARGMLRVSRRQRPVLSFCVERSHEAFEFRLNTHPNYPLQPFRFFGVNYVRSSPVRAPHQAEAMALLAHLIGMRLRDAYKRECL